MKDHEYFVYIMSSSSGTLYIGMANSIYRRALQHKAGEIEGFPSKYHCNRLVYYESFDDVHKAIGREKQLKGWTRARKLALIESKNLRWEDLAESGDHRWRSQEKRSSSSVILSGVVASRMRSSYGVEGPHTRMKLGEH
ncbi:MAG: GIY-YIG nuclease family protein [Candidatus Sulfotelmatobacter sp.]